jgi:PPOX class probable FMN-dependent enzyme
MSDPYILHDEAALRAVIGDELPGVALKVEREITAEARDYIARSPFLVLTTSDEHGNLDASPKGDAPGFVEVQDAHTLLVPDRPGNRLAFGHRNILRNPRVGLLFLMPGTAETVRVNGRAELTRDPALLARLAARGKHATLVTRVHVDECFFHCGKAFIRSHLWQPAQWGEPYKVSFGKMFAKKMGRDDAMAEEIDANIATDYRDNL